MNENVGRAKFLIERVEFLERELRDLKINFDEFCQSQLKRTTQLENQVLGEKLLEIPQSSKFA